MTSELALDPTARRLLVEARRATLATIRPDGSPRLVPICYALHPTVAVLYSPLDEKPKRTDDPHKLARVRDIARDPRVAVLVDRWDEVWAGLAWLRCDGVATLLEPGGEAEGEAEGERVSAIEALRRRYDQYADHDLESRPILRIAIARTTAWGGP
jgi:PPOX class probable F420-dependent enzyme